MKQVGQYRVPLSIGKVLDGILKKCGYRLIPTWRLRQYELAKHTRRIFRELDVCCVVDVGAFIGQYRDFLRHHVGYSGLIVSFEPVSAHVDILKRRAASDLRWVIRPCALGNENVKRELNVMKRPGLTSFLEPNNRTRGKFDDVNIVSSREEVEIRRLAEVMLEMRDMPQFPDRGNVFLKLDTQGFDLEVIRGGGNALSEIAALQTELSVIPIYQNMPTYIRAIEELNQRGFDITGMFPVSRDCLSRVIEFDCIMINRRIAEEQVEAARKLG